jgi:hypothetical protein
MLRDWEYSGPDRGIGSKARVTATAGGRSDTVEIEVIAAARPNTIVERNVSAGGRRIATGTYRLEPLPSGGTRITFEYAWQRAPLSDRVAAPLVRAILTRGNQRAMGAPSRTARLTRGRSKSAIAVRDSAMTERLPIASDRALRALGHRRPARRPRSRPH